MKVMLIYCKEGFNGYLPLGIAYIAAFLKKNRHTTKCIDTSIYSSLQEIKNIIDNEKSDVYGLSVMTPYFGLGMSLSHYIRRKYPSSKIIWGGPHATVRPKEILTSGNVDYVIPGEGEDIFNEVLNHYDNIGDVPGIAYLNSDDELIINSRKGFIEDLDSLPFPERSLFEINRYIKFNNENKLHILFSRGCPFSCTYCQPTLNRIFGKKVRYRSPENVIEEIKYLVGKYNVDNFSFNDDTLTVNRNKFMKFCDLLLTSGIKIQWRFNSRADTIDKEMMLTAVKSGASSVHIGVESGNDYIRETVYKKGIHRDQIISVFNTARKVGINAHAYFMVGAPDETISMVGDTANLIKRIKPEKMQLSKTIPLPGTYLYHVFKEMGLKAEAEASEYIYTKTLITWGTNKLTQLQKERLYQAILLEYSLSLKKAFLAVFSPPFKVAKILNFAYLLARVFLPFKIVNKLWLIFLTPFSSYNKNNQ